MLLKTRCDGCDILGYIFQCNYTCFVLALKTGLCVCVSMLDVAVC